MSVYWLMFLTSAVLALSPINSNAFKLLRIYLFILVFITFTLIIGFRHEVGGDWEAYLNYYIVSTYSSIGEISLIFSDIGYGIVNWFSAQINGDIYLVNTICGAIFMAGLIIFSKQQPLPWLALTIAVPYMVIVVAMGYTRQSVAIGFELMALSSLIKSDMKKTVFFVILGTLFHKTAIILLPLILLSEYLIRHKKSILSIVLVTLVFTLGLMFLYERIEGLFSVYIARKLISSEGGLIRIIMNAIPALIILVFSKKLSNNRNERILFNLFSVISLLSIPLVFSFSTAVDRMALYLTPVQIYAFSRIHRLFSDNIQKIIAILTIMLYYGMALFVWLNFAIHSPFWIPYKFYPLVE